MADTKTTVLITASQTTVGAGIETLMISENGAAPAASIAVPPGTTLVISDLDVSALGSAAGFTLQQDNGAGFFTIASLIISGIGTGGSQKVSPGTAWVIGGGTGSVVVFRAQVSTPGGPLPVAMTISGYREA